jgi:hypothetical protein
MLLRHVNDSPFMSFLLRGLEIIVEHLGLADEFETSCWRARLPTDKTRVGECDDGVGYSRATGLVYIVLRLRSVGVIGWRRSPQYVGMLVSQIRYRAMYSLSRNPAAARTTRTSLEKLQTYGKREGLAYLPS